MRQMTSPGRPQVDLSTPGTWKHKSMRTVKTRPAVAPNADEEILLETARKDFYRLGEQIYNILVWNLLRMLRTKKY